jgi:hypothetical protein
MLCRYACTQLSRSQSCRVRYATNATRTQRTLVIAYLAMHTGSSNARGSGFSDVSPLPEYESMRHYLMQGTLFIADYEASEERGGDVWGGGLGEFIQSQSSERGGR